LYFFYYFSGIREGEKVNICIQLVILNGKLHPIGSHLSLLYIYKSEKKASIILKEVIGSHSGKQYGRS
jgi:hypothetical protein